MEKDYKILIDTINSICQQPEETAEQFLSLFKLEELRKGEYLVEEGVFTSKVAFILSGVMRTFFRNEDGVEYNKTFFMEYSFASPIAAILQRTDSHLSFQALEDCKLLTADFYDIESMYKKHRSIESLVRIILQNDWVIKKEQREIRLVLNNAEERYQYFKNEYPGLENRIPQYHIASHLGITPIQLSRIRAKMVKK